MIQILLIYSILEEDDEKDIVLSNINLNIFTNNAIFIMVAICIK